MMRFNPTKIFISYGGEPQNVCNFALGWNTLAKPKSVVENKLKLKITIE